MVQTSRLLSEVKHRRARLVLRWGNPGCCLFHRKNVIRTDESNRQYVYGKLTSGSTRISRAEANTKVVTRFTARDESAYGHGLAQGQTATLSTSAPVVVVTVTTAR